MATPHIPNHTLNHDTKATISQKKPQDVKTYGIIKVIICTIIAFVVMFLMVHEFRVDTVILILLMFAFTRLIKLFAT
jgi:hypothetical protein